MYLKFLFTLLFNKFQIYEFVMLWLKHNVNERSKFLSELLIEIRLSIMSMDFLNNTVQEEYLIKSNHKCTIFYFGFY